MIHFILFSLILSSFGMAEDLKIFKTKWQQNYLATLDEDEKSLNSKKVKENKKLIKKLLAKSRANWKKGKLQLAAKYAHDVLKINKYHQDALNLIYQIYIDKGDWVRALGTVVLILEKKGAKRTTFHKVGHGF